METYPSEWQGGKVTATPFLRKGTKCYTGDLTIDNIRYREQFHWGEIRPYKTQEEAYNACKEYIYKICKDKGALKNEYRYVNDKVIEVKLNGKDTTRIMTADVEDLDKVGKYIWHTREHGYTFYAQAHIEVEGKMTTLQFHQLVTNFKYKITDHIDGIFFIFNFDIKR